MFLIMFLPTGGLYQPVHRSLRGMWIHASLRRGRGIPTSAWALQVEGWGERKVEGGGCRRSGHGWVGETIGQGMLVMTCGLITAFLDAPVVQNYLFENVPVIAVLT